jgi:two-component system OmpR family response regulator
VRVEKVMVVDDDPSIRLISETCLTKIGKFQVVLASSAREAIELLQTEKPEVILLDVMMPVIDGKTAFPAVRKASGDESVIIFMTAETDRTALESYLSVGAAGIISKPFEITRLCAQVNEIAESYWHKGKSGLPPAAAKRSVSA